MATLSGVIVSSPASAVIIPSRPSLTLTFQDLIVQIRYFQRALTELGIGYEDAISIALPNGLEFVVAFLAVAGQRAIAAPLNPAYKEGEFDFYIADLETALILVPRGAVTRDDPVIRAARKHGIGVAECYLDSRQVKIDLKHKGKLAGRLNTPLAMAQPDDIALVLHTSGTTGRPKAVPLTHQNLTTNLRNINDTYSLSPSDRTMLVMPLFHIHGLQAGLLAPLASGGSVIIPPKFSASTFWDDFVSHGANWYTAVPTIHQILLKHPLPNPMPIIRFIRSCSSSLPPKVLRELEARCKCVVLEAYAMTEAGHQICSNPLPPRERREGSVGFGQGVHVKIMWESQEVHRGSEGEICIKGNNVMGGYLRNEKANQESFVHGWFRTGDQGTMDEEGYVRLTGRIKEMINRGGEKISPIEIDTVVGSCPGVIEAVSFGVPNEMFGQEVGVAVVVSDGVSENDITQWAGERLTEHKKPGRVWMLKEIPKTATGKIQRKKVAEALLSDCKAKL